MSYSYISSDLGDLNGIASQIIGAIPKPSVVLLNGQMGAGKTTLIKSLARSLGVVDVISSPTFSLVNEYLDIAGRTIYHFDLYRLEELEEAFDIGIEEYLDSGSWCFIEWPDIIQSLLPESYWVVDVIVEDGKRLIKLSSPS
ncbi:MAG: tRNA threonylcarbamoyladenosine biosynthesis protein TsaE [Flavobacteriales bacterium]|jgi:tRNA threonylcarbamoyladenosine biosynthesis protein TsaE